MIEVYNFLDGKNICNIFASLIVERINESFPNADTEITVINVRNFFVVKGRTTSTTILNLSDVLREFCLKYNEDLSNTMRVFDIISYGESPTNNHITLTHKEIKDSFKNELTSLVNESYNDGIHFNVKYFKEETTLLYDCKIEQNEIVKTLLKTKYPNITILKSDFTQETYTSDKLYGLSQNANKLYHTLLKYISNHIISRGISSELTLTLNWFNDYKEITNETVNLKISGKHIVKEEWLLSLILDVFPFEYDELKNKFNSYSYHKEIINEGTDLPWNKLDLIRELVLV